MWWQMRAGRSTALRGVCDARAATSKKDEAPPWRYRLFGRPLTKEYHPKKEKQSVSTSDSEASKKKAKKPWWWCFSNNRCRVSQAPEEESPKEKCPSNPHQALPKKQEEVAVSPSKSLRHQHVTCLGFPNPVEICYMNSCLQSLLTLEDFVRDISNQEQVWNLTTEAELIRSFMDIRGSHFSSNALHKTHLLFAFKKAVSLWVPEFQDLYQKDAHEFLTSVLEQMRCLAPELRELAASMNRTYSCPVEDHLAFKMQNTRLCKRCGAGSTREEGFTNLSLDLRPGGGTVEQFLQDYLMETELEYNCECGAATSGQRLSFVTLPRVLLLHLKRFRLTPFFQLEKVHDPVTLFRELVVSSNQGGGCYSLVSAISHIGTTARSGHYICDGVDPDVAQGDTTDRWFTYDDALVTETTSAFVCDQQQRTSYILFYKRQD